MKKLLFFPSKNLIMTIPLILLLGFIIGLNINFAPSKFYILPLTFFMIYPTMIGFRLKEAVDLSHSKVVLLTLLVNFILIPLSAFILGSLFLKNQPELFIGLIMISLFPTSGMTISWTSLSKGNVTAAVKVVAVSLIVGAIVAPLYLTLILGNIVSIDILSTFLTIFQIVILPLLLGNLTYRLILLKYKEIEFQKNIKPMLPAISVWAMLVIVFISVGLKAKSIASNPSMILISLGILVLFYIINYTVITFIAKNTLRTYDGYALLYGTVMRNLSVALGIAVASFSPDTVLIITLAYILQIQSAAWYGKLSQKYNWMESYPSKNLSFDEN